MSRQQIIDKHKNLFWYTPDDKKHDISDALLVERILNDGTLDDCRELIQVLGGKRVAEVFFSPLQACITYISLCAHSRTKCPIRYTYNHQYNY